MAYELLVIRDNPQANTLGAETSNAPNYVLSSEDRDQKLPKNSRSYGPNCFVRLHDPIAPPVDSDDAPDSRMHAHPSAAHTDVAILDTGIAVEHAEFAHLDRSNLLLADFTSTEPRFKSAPDGHGHGTHCAGLLVGRTCGRLSHLRRLLVGKVLDDSGRGDVRAVARGMLWAAEQGAHIISLSLGFDYTRHLSDRAQTHQRAASAQVLAEYQQVIQFLDGLVKLLSNYYPATGGPLIIAAAGNESSRPDYEVELTLPASIAGTLAVGAIERIGERHKVAAFSNSGPSVVDVGSKVTSASHSGGFVSLSGTSMATPRVAATAALWHTFLTVQDPDAPPSLQTLRNALINSCTRVSLPPDISHRHVGVGVPTPPQ